MASIREVKIEGKEVIVYFESNRIGFYAKECDIPKNMKGVRKLSRNVIDFMREHPDKVR